jgi:GT2 family glycosyltransferase
VGDARLTDAGVPPEVEAAARRRAEARADRDWATADRLRGEIEAAGWRIVDSGTRFRLEPASPPSVEVAGEIRYGRSQDVPSLLDEPATGVASVILVAAADADAHGARRCIEALAAHAPAGVDVVVVLDGAAVAAPPGGDALPVETIRTSARLGHGAALNIGIRRARAPIVIVLDAAITPTGDVIGPLVRALQDPGVAVAGPSGLLSDDLGRFEIMDAGAEPADAAAIDGSVMAFRRRDAADRGPIDEAFRSPSYLDVWWSLVLRDAGEDAPPRRAVVVPGMAIERAERAETTGSPGTLQDRRAKRNFYRVLDRFRTRLDLAVPATAQ